MTAGKAQGEDCGSGFADTRCLVGGTLSDRQGVKCRMRSLPLSGDYGEDRADLSSPSNMVRIGSHSLSCSVRRCRRRP